MAPLGNLLVTCQPLYPPDPSVIEYDGTTGAFVKVAASGGALGAPSGLAIGLDGNLLVSDAATNQIKRYDRTTGAFIDVFASTMSQPKGMIIYQGVLYVANLAPDSVQRFDAATGVNTGSFKTSVGNYPYPKDVTINPINNR